MNKDLDFDSLVEVLEDLEEEVECKECFDLFPKAQCLKQDVGYICPTCGKLKMQKPAEYSVFDTYDQEFPEITDYAPETVKDYDQEPKIEDALADLIKDEYEAIDGYEVADEKIQHASIPEDKKDDILDTLEHIKEEEEEHIDELKDLLPGEDKDEDKDDKEDTDESAVQEKLDIDFSNCIDSSDMEIWGVEPVGEATYKAVLLKRFENVPFRGGRDEIEKVESEMFDLGGLFVFHFGKDGLPKLGRWDPELLRSLGNCEIIFDDERYDRACEETLNRSFEESAEEFDDFDLGPQSDELVPIDYSERDLETLAEAIELEEATGFFRRALDKFVNFATGAVRKHTKANININDLFSKGYYIHVEGMPEADIVDANGKSLQDRTAPDLKSAEIAAKNISKRFPKAQVTLMAEDEGVKIEDNEIKKIVERYKWRLGLYRGGSASNVDAIEAINRRIKTLEVAGDNIDANTGEQRAETIAAIQARLLKELGDPKDPQGYTEESYAEYKKAWDDVVKGIKEATPEDKAKLAALDISAMKAELEGKLEEADTALDAEDEDKPDLEGAREACLKLLGEKAAAEGYTPESYAAYSAKYDSYVKAIKAAKQLKTLTDDYPTQLKTIVPKLNAMLVKVSGSNTPVEEPTEEEEDLNLQKKLAAKAFNKGIEKPDAYTEESYADYKESLEDLLTKLKGYTKVAQVKAFIAKIPSLLEQLKELLDLKEDETPDEDEDEIPEGETPEELEEAKKAAHEKLGTPIEGEGYTTESYDKYIEAHDNIIDEIDACETVAEVEAIDIDKKKAEAEGLLEKVAEEPEVNLDELKAQIKEALGPKKDAEPYTEESYAKYSEAYDNTIAQIDKAETEEDIPVTLESVEQHREYLEKNLVEKPKDESPEEEEEETPEEEEETAPAKSKLTSNQITDIVRNVFQNYGKTPEKKVINRIKELLKKKLGESFGTEEEIRTLITEALETGKLGEELLDTDGALASLTDTTKKLKSAAAGMKNMTSAMREEYHKYANPAELQAMDNLRVAVDRIVEQLVLDLAAAGYDDLDYYDSDCYMSGNNSCTITMFLGSEDTFEDGETEELQDHMANIVEEALAQIKLPPELTKIQGGAVFPDTLIMDEDDEANGITRGEITVDVTFARNLV